MSKLNDIILTPSIYLDKSETPHTLTITYDGKVTDVKLRVRDTLYLGESAMNGQVKIKIKLVDGVVRNKSCQTYVY